MQINKDLPLVSIIMPVYNRENIIAASINSVKNQSYKNWELIIVDDFSTDNTWANAEKEALHDSRIRLIPKKTEKKGANNSRNIGFNLSKGEFILFLDSDDLLTEICLENRVKSFKNYQDYDFLVFQTAIFNKKQGDSNLLINTETTDDIYFRYFDLDIPWLTSGPFWKRATLLKLGGWDEDLPSWQDWEFHLRALTRNFKYKYIHTVDNYWRMNSNLSSIGMDSSSIHHLLSQLKLITNIESNFKKDDFRFKKLLGLKIWTLERILNNRIQIKHLHNYFSTLMNYHFAKGILGSILFIFNLNKLLDFQRPRFGTFRKVVNPRNAQKD